MTSKQVPPMSLIDLIVTHMSEASGGDPEHVDHVDGYDEDRGERHHPPHHLTPQWVIVPQVLYWGVGRHSEDKHALKQVEKKTTQWVILTYEHGRRDICTLLCLWCT